MRNVSSLTDFDDALSNYINGTYIKSKYENYLGCQGANLTDTNDYYARYTTSAICNGLVQSSKDDCNLSDDQSKPLCADTCALMATSEQEIVTNSDLCPGLSDDYMSQIRSDFTVCALPADSLTGTCISGADNEPDECGYGPNVMGLCGYCSGSSANSTDSCCTNANAASRCKDVTVPTTTASLPPLMPSSSSNSTRNDASSHHGLSGGQIAGAVVGSVAGFAILVALIVLALLCLRRRRRAESDTALNQPNPQRKGFAPMQNPSDNPGMVLIPGGRVARMSALREMPSLTSRRSRRNFFGGSSRYTTEPSESEAPSASPGRMSRQIPPVTGKRLGSLTSSSFLAATSSDTSPRSGTKVSSPEGISSQSEQMSSFQDYYSQDNIHPGDRVAVLWAYQPRAGDEFSLDRGEMLKIIGIWDDGWATGVRLSESAENYDFKHREQRDSGVSQGSHLMPSPAPTGDIKAFPLVCVCLPQHWKKIIDGASEADGEGSP